MAEANSSDFVAHKKTYESFLKLIKWAAVGLVVLVVFLYLVVSP